MQQNTFHAAVSWLMKCDAIPSAVDEKARLLLLDTIGCMFAGFRHDDVRRFGQALRTAFAGDAVWPGSEIKLGPAGSAAFGAAAACWDEACEGHAEAHGRPGLPVVPCVLALGIARNATWGEVLLALVTGYEIGARSGQAWRVLPGLHVDGSWHSIGVAAAAARLVSGPAAIGSAIEAASCQLPASLYLPVPAGAVVRNIYVSHAVLLGLMAAAAAEAGLSVPLGALEEARRRVLRASADAAVSPAGEWMLMGGYLKPFAGVRHTHYGVEAALRIRARHQFSLADVRAIDLTTYEEAIRYCGNRKPQTAIQAQFSLSYALAAALRLGDLGPEAYGDALFDPEIVRLENLVRIFADPQQAGRGARVAITVGADIFSEDVATVAGDPDRPTSADAVVAKFVRYAEPALGPLRTGAIADFVMSAPASAPIEKLFVEVRS